MSFDCGNLNTDNMSYSQKFAAIIARMHKLKFGNMLTGVSEIEFKTMSAISRISKSGDVKVSDIAKYLERKGCTRVQRSIFLADLDTADYQEIKTDLAEVQSLYDNHDSIIVCPISTDQLRAMRIIGQQIDVDIITHNRNTLFF